MLRLGLCFSLFVCAFFTYAQQDTDLQKKILAKGGYTALSKRFIESDTTLTITDFQLVYYGFQFETSYKPLEIEFKENLVKPYNRAARYADAIQIADSILVIDPVSITAHFEKAFAASQINNKTAEQYHRKRYIVLCNVITHSGKGTKESPYLALSVNDILETLSYLGFQAVNDRQTDLPGIIEFDLAKNKLKLAHIYFFIPPQAYIAPDTNPESE